MGPRFCLKILGVSAQEIRLAPVPHVMGQLRTATVLLVRIGIGPGRPRVRMVHNGRSPVTSENGKGINDFVLNLYL